VQGDSLSDGSSESRRWRSELGGASRDRTDGLVVANDALSQLSYSPTMAGTDYFRIILTAFFGGHQAAAPVRTFDIDVMVVATNLAIIKR
jgi:hypothetical protein